MSFCNGQIDIGRFQPAGCRALRISAAAVAPRGLRADVQYVFDQYRY